MHNKNTSGHGSQGKSPPPSPTPQAHGQVHGKHGQQQHRSNAKRAVLNPTTPKEYLSRVGHMLLKQARSLLLALVRALLDGSSGDPTLRDDEAMYIAKAFCDISVAFLNTLIERRVLNVAAPAATCSVLYARIALFASLWAVDALSFERTRGAEGVRTLRQSFQAVVEREVAQRTLSGVTDRDVSIGVFDMYLDVMSGLLRPWHTNRLQVVEGVVVTGDFMRAHLLASLLASSESSLMLVGEPGTGKSTLLASIAQLAITRQVHDAKQADDGGDSSSGEGGGDGSGHDNDAPGAGERTGTPRSIIRSAASARRKTSRSHQFAHGAAGTGGDGSVSNSRATSARASDSRNRSRHSSRRNRSLSTAPSRPTSTRGRDDGSGDGGVGDGRDAAAKSRGRHSAGNLVLTQPVTLGELELSMQRGDSGEGRVHRAPSEPTAHWMHHVIEQEMVTSLSDLTPRPQQRFVTFYVDDVAWSGEASAATRARLLAEGNSSTRDSSTATGASAGAGQHAPASTAPTASATAATAATVATAARGSGAPCHAAALAAPQQRSQQLLWESLRQIFETRQVLSSESALMSLRRADFVCAADAGVVRESMQFRRVCRRALCVCIAPLTHDQLSWLLQQHLRSALQQERCMKRQRLEDQQPYARAGSPHLLPAPMHVHFGGNTRGGAVADGGSGSGSGGSGVLHRSRTHGRTRARSISFRDRRRGRGDAGTGAESRGWVRGEDESEEAFERDRLVVRSLADVSVTLHHLLARVTLDDVLRPGSSKLVEMTTLNTASAGYRHLLAFVPSLIEVWWLQCNLIFIIIF